MYDCAAGQEAEPSVVKEVQVVLIMTFSSCASLVLVSLIFLFKNIPLSLCWVSGGYWPVKQTDTAVVTAGNGSSGQMSGRAEK